MADDGAENAFDERDDLAPLAAAAFAADSD
jgi:hypothetical protein